MSPALQTLRKRKQCSQIFEETVGICLENYWATNQHISVGFYVSLLCGRRAQSAHICVLLTPQDDVCSVKEARKNVVRKETHL